MIPASTSPIRSAFCSPVEQSAAGMPLVSKVTRSGVLPQKIYLEYSQQRLASYGVQQSQLGRQRNGREVCQYFWEVVGENVLQHVVQNTAALSHDPIPGFDKDRGHCCEGQHREREREKSLSKRHDHGIDLYDL